MKAEKVLARVNDILTITDANTNTALELQEFIKELKEQVRREYAASTGKASVAKAMREITELPRREGKAIGLQYAWMDNKGRQCVCDGYRAVRLNNPVPLEDRPEGAEIPLDLDKVMPNIRHDYSETPLPTKAELKAFIATEKALHGRKYDPIWYIVDGEIAVNAQYLLTLIEALPDATEIYYNNTYDGWKKPLYIQSVGGDAVLLPVNIHKRQEE